jgi:hypothetical protein
MPADWTAEDDREFEMASPEFEMASPPRLARAHADVVTHPSDYHEAQRSQRTLWRSLLAWSSSQAKTSVRQ